MMKLLAIICMLCIAATAQQFPIAPLGMCYDGVRDLAGYYPGRDVRFAYTASPAPGHTWLLVDGYPIDSYYGPMEQTRYWMFPDQTFGSYAELQNYVMASTVHQCPVTGMWETDRRV